MGIKLPRIKGKFTGCTVQNGFRARKCNTFDVRSLIFGYYHPAVAVAAAPAAAATILTFLSKKKHKPKIIITTSIYIYIFEKYRETQEKCMCVCDNYDPGEKGSMKTM